MGVEGKSNLCMASRGEGGTWYDSLCTGKNTALRMILIGDLGVQYYVSAWKHSTQLLKWEQLTPINTIVQI